MGTNKLKERKTWKLYLYTQHDDEMCVWIA